MEIYDISQLIHPQIPTWPGHPQVKIERFKKMEQGEGSNASWFGMSVHAGTHVDAPRHFIEDGATIDQLEIKPFVGMTQVVEFPGDTKVLTASDFDRAGIASGIQRVICKTENSRRHLAASSEFVPDFVALAPDAADWLIAHCICLIGIDSPSIAIYHESGHSTHVRLLSKGLIIVEGLDLAEIRPGHYFLVCLPLRLAGSEAAPARTVLIDHMSMDDISLSSGELGLAHPSKQEKSYVLRT